MYISKEILIVLLFLALCNDICNGWGGWKSCFNYKFYRHDREDRISGKEIRKVEKKSDQNTDATKLETKKTSKSVRFNKDGNKEFVYPDEAEYKEYRKENNFNQMEGQKKKKRNKTCFRLINTSIKRKSNGERKKKVQKSNISSKIFQLFVQFQMIFIN